MEKYAIGHYNLRDKTKKICADAVDHISSQSAVYEKYKSLTNEYALEAYKEKDGNIVERIPLTQKIYKPLLDCREKYTRLQHLSRQYNSSEIVP